MSYFFGIPRLFHTEFPRNPIGVLKDHLTIEADNRLGCYLPIPEPEQPPDPNLPPPPERPNLPEDVVDAPLTRLYNFLRKFPAYILCILEAFSRAAEMMSMSYQLEILWYQVCPLKLTPPCYSNKLRET
jgi:mediator of RNA polymerase II transcription subunit 14